jgi:hypothetical protein
MFNEQKINAKNGILVSSSIVGTFIFPNYHRHFMVSMQDLSSNDSHVVLTFCSLNLVAHVFACLKLHRVSIGFHKFCL